MPFWRIRLATAVSYTLTPHVSNLNLSNLVYMTPRRCLSLLALPGFILAVTFAHAQNAPSNTSGTFLMDTMDAELHRAMSSLGKAAGKNGEQPAPYFLSYSVSDNTSWSLAAQYGSLISDADIRHNRTADVQVRIGSPAQDNTHGDHRNSALTTIGLPLTNDRAAIARSLWYATNRGYGRALDGYLKVKTEQQVRAKEEDTSNDFSVEKPVISDIAPDPTLTVDREKWATRLRELSAMFRAYRNIYYSVIGLTTSDETDYFLSSEGTKVTTPYHRARIVVVARARAEDGMDLFRVETFEADTLNALPPQAEIAAKITAMAKNLEALRIAPITEPYNGPAILSGRASAVFFHEVLGHRLEGQRQRGDEEGQTFTKMLGKNILPSFMSVKDDPTLATFNNIPLNGTYRFDDEGQPARRVDLITNGTLKTFLMSRIPIASFSNSNGHGRAQSGRMPNGRQGNLIVTSTKTVSDAELRKMLIDEAKKQGKSYGLYFEDISSGFAVTTRRSPQAFQVIPLVVYRVYVDGRPDELVRGVSIVGTPLTALNRIIATGNHQDVFNGECGAESGTVPVAAIAPPMLVSEIETQRQAQGTSRPPILPPPAFDDDALPAKKEAR